MIRGSTKIFLETLAACLLVAVLLTGFAIWRLGNGPISIDAVTPYIESALSDPSSGRRVSIGASGLIWDPRDHAIEVRADRVSVFDAVGQAVIVVPEMTLRFHLPALIRGIFAPRTITLIRPAVTVIRTADGGWEISAVPESEQGPAAAGDAALALDLIARSLSQLDRFRLIDARLTIDDRRAHALWVVPEMSIALTREHDRFLAESAVALDVDGQRVPIRATARLDGSFNVIDADLAVAELVPAKIARRIAELNDIAPLDLPLGGTVHFAQQGAGGGPELGFAITGGAGQLVRPELVDGALPVSSLAVRGTYRIDAQDLQLDELALVLPTTSITLAGTAHDLGGEAAVEGKLAIGSLPLDDLHKYWPPDLAPNPRRWMLANLAQGAIRDTALKFAAHRVGSSVALDALEGSMAVDGARVRYLKGQPSVEQVAGLVRFDAQHFDITISAGRLRGLKIDSAQLTIGGLADRDQQMTMSVGLSGPLSDGLVVLDMPPFGYVHRLGRAPQSITGDVTGRLSLKFPLVDRLTLDDVGLSATASLSALHISKVVRDFDLTEGKFDLNLDKVGLHLTGQGQIGGVPASVGWIENFERTAPFQRRYDVAATLTDDGRRALGVELEDYLSGPIALTMVYSDLKGGRSSLVGNIDFGAAALKLDDLSWKKPAGRPATGQFEARLTDGKLTSLERAELSGAGLTVRATGGFGAQGRLAKLDIAQLKVDATDVAAQLAWDGERVDVALSGRSLDASALFGAEDVGTKPPRAMTISAKLDHVIVGAGRALDKVDLRADSDGTRWRTADISGVAGSGAMRLALAPRAAGRDLTVTADDAGGVLKTFGLTDDMQGGKLRIEGRYDDTVAIDRLQARVTIDAYRLVRAPLLAKMLAVSSITGIPDLLSGEGIGFQELSMQVVKSPGRLEIVDGRTSGRAMGLTVQGTIEGPDDTAELTGTLVPIASVNRLFESIPLIGEIVTGGGGGLFAFTYAVHGPMDNPSVTLNPLSVLAPGFLRNLFRWQLPGGGASSMPPASTSGQ